MTAWSLHDIRDVDAHLNATIERALHHNGGTLTTEARQELLQYLRITAWRLADRYDPTLSTQTFSTYLGRISYLRINDFYRKTCPRRRRKQPLDFCSLNDLDPNTATPGSEAEEVISNITATAA